MRTTSHEDRPRIAKASVRLAPLALALIALSGCHQDMYDQPKVKPYAESNFFNDRTSFRPLMPGTIARGELRADRHRDFGQNAEGKPVDTFPFPVTEDVMSRGRERYQIYCYPCHGATGSGDGMIVRRGLGAPPSFGIDRLKEAPVGHYFDVITNGYGAMYPYGYRVPVDDRWAIIAYVRALQYRQNAQVADLPAPLRERLEAPR
jgi:mono/diheme cytochrome c family protein